MHQNQLLPVGKLFPQEYDLRPGQCQGETVGTGEVGVGSMGVLVSPSSVKAKPCGINGIMIPSLPIG